MSRWLPLLPALLLVMVAAHQIHAARSHGLTPWKGGGFGMFASTDMGPARRVQVRLLRAGGATEIGVPESLAELATRVRFLPTDPRLRALARRIAETLPDELGVYSALRVEIWQIRFAPEDLAPCWTLLRALDHAPAADAS